MAGRYASSFRLYIGRLPWTVANRELKEYFAQFGNIRRAVVAFDKQTGFSKRFGFVEFSNEEGYRNTVQRATHIVDGTRVFVRPQTGGGGRRGPASRPSLEKLSADNILGGSS
ncbi:SRA stem-loop-interacting RNA-binding protein, mitochondrial-like [Glandiceps talaboti]